MADIKYLGGMIDSLDMLERMMSCQCEFCTLEILDWLQREDKLPQELMCLDSISDHEREIVSNVMSKINDAVRSAIDKLAGELKEQRSPH